MRAVSTHGQICLNDTYGFIYKIAKLEYTLWEDDSFRYVFTPNYSVVDLLSPKLFQGIPGLDLSCRKPQYVRMNRTPVFISERTPSEHREDLLSLLNECQMDHLNRLEWLIRTKSRYSGDDLYVLRFDPEEPTAVEVDDLSTLGPRGIDIIRKLLEILCAGKTFSSPDVVIDDVTRAQYYHLLLALYRQEKSYLAKRQREGINKAVTEGRYEGRKPIKIEVTRFWEVVRDYRDGKLTGKAASQKLGISYSTFYSRLKAFQNNTL